MTISRLMVTSVEARRFLRPEEAFQGQVRVDHSSSVTAVRAVNENDAQIEFRFTASYGPVGLIKIEGALQGTWQAQAKDLEEAWRSRTDMPRDVAQQVHQAVMAHCVPVTVVFSREIQLPPPIPLPAIRLPDKQTTKAAGIGPEVA